MYYGRPQSIRNQPIPGEWEGGRLIRSPRSSNMHEASWMQIAQNFVNHLRSWCSCFWLYYREWKYLLSTVSSSLPSVSFTKTAVIIIITIILLIFSFECHEVFLLLLSIKSIISILVPQSILLELQWLFIEIICGSNYCDCNLLNINDLVECADAVIGGGQAWQCSKTWDWEVTAMKGQRALELVADYGWVHTHNHT